MRKIKKGDEVMILAGRDKGSRGTVKRVVVGKDGRAARVLVEGAGTLKKHRRPNPQINDPGGIVTIESPMHISNVAVFNPAAGRGGRVRIQTGADGKKNRVFAADGKAV